MASPCSAPTNRRRTGPACAITSTSTTSPPSMSPRCGRKSASHSASATARGAPETPRSWSPIPRDSARSCEARSLGESPRTRGSGRCLTSGARCSTRPCSARRGAGPAKRGAGTSPQRARRRAYRRAAGRPQRRPPGRVQARLAPARGAPLGSTKKCGVQAAMATSNGVGLLARLSAQLCIPHFLVFPVWVHSRPCEGVSCP